MCNQENHLSYARFSANGRAPSRATMSSRLSTSRASSRSATASTSFFFSVNSFCVRSKAYGGLVRHQQRLSLPHTNIQQKKKKIHNKSSLAATQPAKRTRVTRPRASSSMSCAVASLYGLSNCCSLSCGDGNDMFPIFVFMPYDDTCNIS